ncbi:MAG: Uma2 family endonuclease [Gemmataceae bacterium]|nr:Uma2 family endonuclease [Gemmataceae bacterium]
MTRWPLTGLEPYRLAEDDLARFVEAGIVDAGCELDEGIVTLEGEPFRFSIARYDRMSGSGFLPEKPPYAVLVEGLLVQKMIPDPIHANGVESCYQLLLLLLLGRPWTPRSEKGAIIGTSEFLPDTLVARGDRSQYWTRHPTASDIGLVIEVANTTLHADRTHMARIYGAAGIPVYWIINLVDGQVEVMTNPTATGYADRMDYQRGEAVPVVLDGVHVGDLLVDDLLP